MPASTDPSSRATPQCQHGPHHAIGKTKKRPIKRIKNTEHKSVDDVQRQAANGLRWTMQIVKQIGAQSRLKEQGDCAFQGDAAMQALRERLHTAHLCLLARAKEARKLFMWSTLGEIDRCIHDEAFVEYTSMNK